MIKTSLTLCFIVSIIFLTICTSLAILPTLSQSLWLIIVELGLVTIGMFSVQSVAPTYLGDLVPSDRATLAVAYQSFFYMGGALGTLVPAWAWRYAGFSGVVWLCVGLVVLGSFGFVYNTIFNKAINKF